MSEENKGVYQEFNYEGGSYSSGAQPAKKRKKGVWIAIAVLLVLAAGTLAAFSLVSRDRALEKLDALAFADASEQFDWIPFGSTIFPKESEYIAAGKLAAEGKYAESADAFAALGSYREAETAAKETRYLQAEAATESGDYLSASELFSAVGDYKDAKEQELNARLLRADALAQSGNYESAKEVLRALLQEKYEPAQEKLLEVCKASAKAYANNGEYGKAYLELKELAGTNEIDTLLRTYRRAAYEAAQKAYRNEDILGAEELFNAVGDDYEDVFAYQILISVRKKTYATVEDAQQDAGTLTEIIRFEDAGELLLSNLYLAEQFLYGIWENGSSYFMLDADGSIYYNLPEVEYGDYYDIENGKVQLYAQASPNAPKTLFTIRVISADCIMVTAMLDGSVYTLFRS